VRASSKGSCTRPNKMVKEYSRVLDPTSLPSFIPSLRYLSRIALLQVTQVYNLAINSGR
jgi:hypothetical protein